MLRADLMDDDTVSSSRLREGRFARNSTARRIGIVVFAYLMYQDLSDLCGFPFRGRGGIVLL